jgi:hypothetical protein
MQENETNAQQPVIDAQITPAQSKETSPAQKPVTFFVRKDFSFRHFVIECLNRFFPRDQDKILFESLSLEKAIREHYKNYVRTKNPDPSSFLREIGRLQHAHCNVVNLYARADEPTALDNLGHIKAYMSICNREDIEEENIKNVLRCFFLKLWQTAKGREIFEQIQAFEMSMEIVTSLRASILGFIKVFVEKYPTEAEEACITISGAEY